MEISIVNSYGMYQWGVFDPEEECPSMLARGQNLTKLEAEHSAYQAMKNIESLRDSKYCPAWIMRKRDLWNFDMSDAT